LILFRRRAVKSVGFGCSRILNIDHSRFADKLKISKVELTSYDLLELIYDDWNDL